jgi:hypothetical protein
MDMSSEAKVPLIEIHRVTHEKSRLAELGYWSNRTMEERVIAGWQLAEDRYNLPGSYVEAKPAGIVVLRVRRPRR